MNIDLKYLKEQGLTPDYYVALRLLKEQRYEELDIFGDIIDLVIGELIVNNYIICISNSYVDRSKLLLTKKAQDLFKVNLVGAEKLWNDFPSKVSNGKGGYRVLKPISLDSEQFKSFKVKYKAYVKGKPELEEKIHSALLTQLDMERNSLMYLQNFQTWWLQKTFEKYYDVEAKEEISISSPKAI